MQGGLFFKQSPATWHYRTKNKMKLSAWAGMNSSPLSELFLPDASPAAEEHQGTLLLQDSSVDINIAVNQVGKQALISCIVSSVNRVGQTQFPVIKKTLALWSVSVCKLERNQRLKTRILAKPHFPDLYPIEKTARKPLPLILWIYLKGQFVKFLLRLLTLAAGLANKNSTVPSCSALRT